MKYSESVENRVLTVSMFLSDSEYLLWRKELDGKECSKVYFEFNNQSNGGYNHIAEISLMRDGIHLVKSDYTLEHFYFDISFKDYNKLVRALIQIYSHNPEVIDVIDE
ncbi:hypothetical protein [Acinetobacter sp. 3657]|uniref:hypothetical protein n=1 Tax=Acinetobacter sp. 3657 TaxID=2817764 RepID=UPI00285B4F77|nr:hypothetical protein [Prolinoborus sp. 3657]